MGLGKDGEESNVSAYVDPNAMQEGFKRTMDDMDSDMDMEDFFGDQGTMPESYIEQQRAASEQDAWEKKIAGIGSKYIG